MNAGLREIAVITNTENVETFKTFLGDGSQWGIRLEIIAQDNPNGLPEAFILSEKFIDGDDSVLMLGDNMFYGYPFLQDDIDSFSERYYYDHQCLIYGFKVKDPQRYGVIELGADKYVKSIVEKPKKPKSDIAAVGLYIVDSRASDIAKGLEPSERGELEIVDMMKYYLH